MVGRIKDFDSKWFVWWPQDEVLILDCQTETTKIGSAKFSSLEELVLNPKKVFIAFISKLLFLDIIYRDNVG